MKVYKYRSIAAECFDRDVDMFSKNQFFASTFAPQNDIFEGKYHDGISQILPVLGSSFNVNTKEVEASLQAVFASVSKLGIFCLCRTSTNHQMWAYYSSSHHGYCIEYDLHKLKDATLGSDYSQQIDVVYSDAVRELAISDLKQHTFIQKAVGTKGVDFKHEDELRLIFDTPGLKSHHPSAITGIYFGARAGESLINHFKQAFEGRDITFYKIVANKDLYQLDNQVLFTLHRTFENDFLQFDYEILSHRENKAVENFDVYFGGSLDEKVLRTFVEWFRTRHCYKPSNINIFSNRDIRPLLTGDRLEGMQYIQFADAFIAGFDFGSDYMYSKDTYKNQKYWDLVKLQKGDR